MAGAERRPPGRLKKSYAHIRGFARAKLVALLTRFAGDAVMEKSPRLMRTALDVGGPCVEAF